MRILILALAFLPHSTFAGNAFFSGPIRLLEPKQSVRLGLKPDGVFTVAPDGEILLQTKDNIFGLAGRTLLLRKKQAALEFFNFTPDGLLMTVTHGKLGYFRDGEIVEQIKLPSAGMKFVAAEKDVIFLYGQVREKEWAVYLYRKGSDYMKFFELDLPVMAVAPSEKGAFLATGKGIIEVVPGKRIKPVAQDPKHEVRSLAYDQGTKTLFFSTSKIVYMWRSGVVVKLLSDMGGDLQLSDSLYVYDPAAPRLVKIPRQVLEQATFKP